MNLKDIEHKFGLNKSTIAVLIFFYCCYLLILDSLALIVPIKKNEPLSRKKLLIIKLDAIGDFVVWLDFAMGLREIFPSQTHEVTLVGNVAWCELAEKLTYFDKLISVDRMKVILNPLYRLRLMVKIRRGGFDTVIDPTFSREFPLTPSLVRTSGAAVRIAPEGDTSNQRQWQKTLSDRWYTSLTESSKLPRTELARNADFLRSLGHTQYLSKVPSLSLNRDLTIPVIETRPYYILFLGAGWVCRQWPTQNFASLATRIYEVLGWEGVICGGKTDADLANSIIGMTDAPLMNMAGRTTLYELANIIADAFFLVGNETSAIHLAAALSTPSICILGGGHFGRFVPYQVEVESEQPLPLAVFKQMDCYHCNWHCIYPINDNRPVPCVASITVEEVWDAITIITGRAIDEPSPA